MTFNEKAEVLGLRSATSEVSSPTRSRVSGTSSAPWTSVLDPIPARPSLEIDESLDLRSGRLLLSGLDAGLAMTLLVIVYRLLVGRIYFEIGEIEVSVWQFRNPCTILVLLYLARRILVARLLRRAVPDLPRSLHAISGAPVSLQIIPTSQSPGRLLVLVGGLLVSVLLTFNSSTQDIERYWSRAGEILTHEHSEAFGPDYRTFMMFIEKCQDQIPENEGIFLVTDQRPFHLNYYLLPRRVYLPLDFQKSLDLRNTYGEDKEGPLPKLDGVARAAFFKQMGVEWIVHWYGPRSSRNRIERVPITLR